MEEQIEYLIKIQKIDIQISEILKQKETFPKRIAELKGILKKDLDDISKIESSIAEGDKERRKLQGEVDLGNERIERIEQKLPQIKTNKEYQALNKEVSNMKKEVKRNEDSILELLESEEKLKSQLKEKKEHYEKEEKEITVKVADYESEISKFDQRISNLETEKKNYTKNVDSKYLAAYERIRGRRDGVAIVAAIKGVCQGCFMNIPPQLFILVQKNSELNNCPNCSRILYWKEG